MNLCFDKSLRKAGLLPWLLNIFEETIAQFSIVVKEGTKIFAICMKNKTISQIFAAIKYFAACLANTLTINKCEKGCEEASEMINYFPISVWNITIILKLWYRHLFIQLNFFNNNLWYVAVLLCARTASHLSLRWLLIYRLNCRFALRH